MLAGGLVSWSFAASALGLGEITLHSALNQPLRADIVLVDAAGLEEGDLSVNLATADEFGRAGVERVFFLNDLTFTPILRGNRSVIRVSSSKPVNEPFLNFLVQLNQPNGRLLREYTVLIDPPGAPGVVPVADEPGANAPNSPFPSVTPATPPPATKKTAAKPDARQPAAPVIDPLSEQLAASVLQNQQLQKTIDELNPRLLAQDEQIAAQKKQVVELQTRLAEIQQAPPVAAPVAPVASAPAPVVIEESEPVDWPMIIGLLALVGLLLLGLFIRRRRQQATQHTAVLAEPLEPILDRDEEPAAETSALKHAPLHHEETPSGDVLEGVGIYIAYGRFSEASALLREALAKEPQRTDLALRLLEVLGKQGDVPAYDAQEQSLIDSGFDSHQLEEIRERYPKMATAPTRSAAAPMVAPVIAAMATPFVPSTPSTEAPTDEFHLNLDDLSMDSSWDVISPFDGSSSANEPARTEESEFSSSLKMLPVEFDMSDEPSPDEAELEWVAEPDAETLDDAFLDGFSDPLQSFELEPASTESIELEPAVPAHADKLEQAQTCIDDGDLDSAIALLNELLEDGDEPLRQTARTLLAGIQ